MTAPPTHRATADGGLAELSVVIPVFNEERWVARAVRAVAEEARSAGIDLDVVAVDDGSTDGTPEVLARLAARTGARVVTQANAGRLAARTRGVAEARHGWVLLLDSRVVVRPGSLAWVRAQLAEHPERRVWCGHVDVEAAGNPFAAFWSGLVKIGWRGYTADPRLLSFGLEDFDRYPKGTGCLLIPADLLREAAAGFRSLYDDPTLSSDDTRLLRYVAGRERIWLSPDFRFTYHGKTGLRGFARQSYFRGTTFVDSYLGQAGAVRRALLAVLGTAAAVGVVGLRRPALGGAGLAAALVALPTVVRSVGGTPAEVRSAALLTPVFLPVFGAGVLRGLALAATGASRTRATPAA